MIGGVKLYMHFLLLYSFMGRGIIDFPVPRIAEAIQDMHKIQNWERYLVVRATVVGACVCVCAHV